MLLWNRTDDLPFDPNDGSVNLFEVRYSKCWHERPTADLLRACRLRNRNEAEIVKRLLAGETIKIGLGRWRKIRAEES